MSRESGILDGRTCFQNCGGQRAQTPLSKVPSGSKSPCFPLFPTTTHVDIWGKNVFTLLRVCAVVSQRELQTDSERETSCLIMASSSPSQLLPNCFPRLVLLLQLPYGGIRRFVFLPFLSPLSPPTAFGTLLDESPLKKKKKIRYPRTNFFFLFLSFLLLPLMHTLMCLSALCSLVLDSLLSLSFFFIRKRSASSPSLEADGVCRREREEAWKKEDQEREGGEKAAPGQKEKYSTVHRSQINKVNLYCTRGLFISTLLESLLELSFTVIQSYLC